MTEEAKPKQWVGAVEIPVDQVEPDPLNANAMSPATFSEFCQHVDTVGFDEPIKVAPLMDEKTAKQAVLPDGRLKYVIIGGEHRWKYAKLRQMATIPSVIRPVGDVAKRRMDMVKENLLRGELDRTKFNVLIRDLAARKSIQTDELAKGMGFTSDKHFKTFFKDQKAATDGKMAAAIQEARKEIVLADNLAYVLSELLSKYGSTMPEGWVFFAHKNRLNLMLQMEPELYKAVQVLCAWAKRDKKLLQDVLDSAIRNELKKWGVDADAFDMKDDDQVDDLPSDRLDESERGSSAEEPLPLGESVLEAPPATEPAPTETSETPKA